MEAAAELLKLLVVALLQAQAVAGKTDAEVEQMFAEEKAKMQLNDPANIPDLG